MSVRATIARNTLFNIAGRAFEGLFGLTLTWYVVNELGTEGWGMWSLVAVFTGYAALFDLGIGSGFAKYIAEYEARGERQKISMLITTGLTFYFLLSLMVVSATWVLADTLIDRVLIPLASGPHLSPDMVEDLRFLCRGAVVLFGLNNCIAPFANVPVGLQRMEVSNALSAGVTVVKFFAALAFIELGWGVRGIFAAQAVSVVLLGVGCVTAAFVLVPGLRVGPRQLNRPVFNQLFSFGWRTQVAKLAGLIDFQTDRMVVASVYKFGDMGLVGLYGIGEYLATKMRQIPNLLVSALIPAASQLDAQSREKHLEQLYLHSTKYMAAVTFPLALGMMATADLMLHAWLGGQEGLGQAAGVTRILCAGYLCNLLPGPGMSIVLGKGLATTSMYAGLLSMTVNIVASISLFYAIGFYGIPAGTSIGMLAASSWFFLYTRRHIRVPLGLLVRRALLWPAVACVPGMAMSLAIDELMVNSTGHLRNLAGLLAAIAVFAVSYFTILLRSPFLDTFDRAFLLKTLRLERIPGARRLLGVTHAQV